MKLITGKTTQLPCQRFLAMTACLFVAWVGVLCGSVSAETIPSLVAPASPIHYPIVNNTWTSDIDPTHYNPAYPPGVTSFDLQGRPYIRHGTVIWTINDSNTGWEARDAAPAIKAAYPAWDGRLSSGYYADERVLFDAAGNAYTFMNTEYYGHQTLVPGYPHTGFLMFSTDKCKTWKFYPVTGFTYSMWQVQDQNTNYNQPPVMMIFNDGGTTVNNFFMELLVPSRNGSTLTYTRNKINETAGCLGMILHSGGSQLCTNGNFVHLVWGSQIKATNPVTAPNQDVNGTACYATTFDRTTGATTGATFLGYAGQAIDGHNDPVVTVTSDGRVHALTCGHDYNFMTHATSVNPNDTRSFGFEDVQENGARNTSNGRTYATLICDQHDVLHCAMRTKYWNGPNQANMCMVYIKKDTRAGTSWTTPILLAVPGRVLYQNWHNHLSYYKYANLVCLSFDFYTDQLTYSDYNAYINTWPGDNVQAQAAPPNDGKSWLSYGVNGHFPGLLYSTDVGSSWRVPSTANFIGNISTYGTLPNGTYTLTARHSGKVLDVSGYGTTDGSNVWQYQSTGASNQRWTVTSIGNGQYQLQGVQSGKMLEVYSSSTSNGGNVDIWSSNNTATQKWTITPTDSGYYKITNVNSGKVLDVAGAATNNGVNVDQSTWNGGANQQWSFTP